VGNATWGNEADFFRFANPSKLQTAIPLIVSVFIGEILFPATGWLLARISNAVDVGTFTKFMNDYSFGNAPWITAAVLTIAYFALNDGNLYGAVNGLEDFWKAKRHHLVLALVAIGSLFSVVLSHYSNALDTVAIFSAVLLPCATVIIMYEYYFAHKIANKKLSFQSLQNLLVWVQPDDYKPASFCWSALIALFSGWVVAVATSGAFPQLAALHSGVWILYSWGSSFAVYGLLRLIVMRLAIKSTIPTELAPVAIGLQETPLSSNE
jgi:hypothetical protein